MQFEARLRDWFELEQPTVVDFHNMFFRLFFDMEIPEFQAARIFIFWVETDFYTIIEQYAHHDAYYVLEEAHMSFLADIHIWNLQIRMKQLRKQWDIL